MSVELFVAALAAGAALLALWVYVRFPRSAPSSVLRTVAHLGLAGVVLFCFVPETDGSPSAAFGAAFLIVLPGLVYVFLASIWMLRLMQAATGGPR
jgi:hypothetical protein